MSWFISEGELDVLLYNHVIVHLIINLVFPSDTPDLSFFRHRESCGVEIDRGGGVDCDGMCDIHGVTPKSIFEDLSTLIGWQGDLFLQLQDPDSPTFERSHFGTAVHFSERPFQNVNRGAKM